MKNKLKNFLRGLYENLILLAILSARRIYKLVIRRVLRASEIEYYWR